MKKEPKITLNPEDYIVLKGGLKIENISKDNCIEVVFPKSYSITPMKYTQVDTSPIIKISN